MLILRIGLYLSIALALYATWISLRAGYPIEVAAVRGLLAFMGGSFVAYLAELVVMTAPVTAQRADRAALTPDAADDEEDESVELTVTRGGRDVTAADQRRAA